MYIQCGNYDKNWNLGAQYLYTQKMNLTRLVRNGYYLDDQLRTHENKTKKKIITSII